MVYGAGKRIETHMARYFTDWQSDGWHGARPVKHHLRLWLNRANTTYDFYQMALSLK